MDEEVFMEQIALRLASKPFDWCYPCAEMSIRDKAEKYKIFAYLFIQYATSHKEMILDYTTVESNADEKTFLFTIRKEVFENWDLPFYEHERYMAKYYKFLKYTIKEHFLKYGCTAIDDKIGYAFQDGNLLITVSRR